MLKPPLQVCVQRSQRVKRGKRVKKVKKSRKEEKGKTEIKPEKNPPPTLN